MKQEENTVNVKLTKDVGISCSIIGELLKHVNKKEIDDKIINFKDKTEKASDEKESGKE